jgi:hypothetical protein
MRGRRSARPRHAQPIRRRGGPQSRGDCGSRATSSSPILKRDAAGSVIHAGKSRSGSNSSRSVPISSAPGCIPPRRLQRNWRMSRPLNLLKVKGPRASRAASPRRTGLVGEVRICVPLSAVSVTKRRRWYMATAERFRPWPELCGLRVRRQPPALPRQPHRNVDPLGRLRRLNRTTGVADAIGGQSPLPTSSRCLLRL